MEKLKIASAISASVYSWRSVRCGRPRTPMIIMESPEPSETRGGVSGISTSIPKRAAIASIVALWLGLQQDSTTCAIKSLASSKESQRRLILQSPLNIESASANSKYVSIYFLLVLPPTACRRNPLKRVIQNKVFLKELTKFQSANLSARDLKKGAKLATGHNPVLSMSILKVRWFSKPLHREHDNAPDIASWRIPRHPPDTPSPRELQEGVQSDLLRSPLPQTSWPRFSCRCHTRKNILGECRSQGPLRVSFGYPRSRGYEYRDFSSR